jgi:hypothetical protein
VSLFFRIFEHLLPQAKVVWLKLDNVTRQFFEGLTGLPVDTKTFIDGIWENIDPDTTQCLDMWEAQFALPDVVLTEAQRRARLLSAWSAQGGQSPRYIEDALQAAGFDVYVHEWWEVPVIDPLAPVARDPNLYLSSGSPFWLCCLDDDGTGGSSIMELGEPTAEMGESLNPRGYPLVNKIATSVTLFLGMNDPEMELDEPLAQMGNDQGITFGEVVYTIPVDPLTYPYFLYIGAETFPNQAVVPGSRREEFENLLLTICPGQQWLGVLVDYS